MLNINFLISFLILTIISACSSQERVINISTEFLPSEAEFIFTEGSGKIEGQAFLRQRGGGIVTCAGSTVFLIPKTGYADERMRHMYGSEISGLNSLHPPIKFLPETFDYSELTRQETCDANGNFYFERVAKGSYYLTTTVFWNVANRPQGGALMKAVDVADGRKNSVILSTGI